MPNLCLSMKVFREVLRLRFETEYSLRQIARMLEVSPSTVSTYLRRFRESDLNWPLPEQLDDDALASKVRPAAASSERLRDPDWAWVERKLSRRGMTLERVWEAYGQDHAKPYSYSQFCRLYQARQVPAVSMRLVHPAGEVLYVDYAGTPVPYVDPATGKICKAQVFVATRGYSHYTFVVATPNPRLPSWIEAHQRAFSFFGAVPRVVVCDNLKAAVKRAKRYDPELNPTYLEMARHYGVDLVPARAYTPKDKSIVEGAVGLVTRRILSQ